ncbi:MAG: hypothetical protein UU08_C0009G0008 [Candidatus Uhrbacteria bacterium GW2011_GWE2_40_58]|nr:MAG: hypothetical protein UT94_C0017G0011 [Candidatus Uhrbacteria bacterium GW2011_GWF2_40_263]KKR67746.1 MAG: hypothetical protein UU08_C0009G0008 [Candidatus Uhrbacteria bacterium GW2011_GWE2_40_58]OGL92187.1 MAG: hypothetical protein A2239_02955 [Candidatus Uhrbacteria bacterium RIFOXYA2_FULL_40_9]OGL96722.1 MAG: hypothetical protein A2332_00375 [Candidatus Uhrbacteria bacterium RIFOXYB2_FULL_41_18]HBK35305.1 hypothetical protein [Candidatus Uhrbacteria bacterium]
MITIRELFCSSEKKISRVLVDIQTHTVEILACGFVASITLFIFSPSAAIADIDTGPQYPNQETVDLMISAMQNKSVPYGTLPVSEEAVARKFYTIPVTAYSSTVDQCDDDPFITANGEYVSDGGIAANFLPFGTKIKIPELYGDKVFTVNDRMNKRYYHHADIWMPTREEAVHFGIKYVTIEVF